MEKPKILIIDDDEPIRTQMKWGLAQEYDTYLAGDTESAKQILEKERPRLVTLDLGLPPSPEDVTEGLKLLDSILEFEKGIKVVVVSGNPDKTAALEAISKGAYDFFTKPIDILELKHILKRAHYINNLEEEYRKLQNRLKQPVFSEMIGSCPKMQDIFVRVRKVATSDVPVLITGESGTGKELVAKAIHSNSARQNMPFVAINCGAIPEALLESELFGHEKGAFTGAHMLRKGKAELADGGTLFLDEIGELSPTLQVKFLRFLQDHKIERVGGRNTISVDLRIIAATNKDLKKLIEEGKFREDLFYRLAVINICLPPLRERSEDVILLAKTFLAKYSDPKSPRKSFSQEAIGAISGYSWPGNVRELENKIRHAITFSNGQLITPEDIGLEQTAVDPQPLNLKKAKDELVTRLIHTAIAKNGGNMSKAADELGLTRPTLYNLMKKYNLYKNYVHNIEKGDVNG